MPNTLGSVSQVPGGVGFDAYPLQTAVSGYPPVPWALTAGTYVSGTTGTASSESGASSTFSNLTTAAIYVNPYYVDQPVVWRHLEHDISADTVAGTGSVTCGWYGALYQDVTTWKAGSGVSGLTSGTVVSRVSAWEYNVRVSQNSVTAQTYSLGSGSASTAWATTAGNLSTDFTGQMRIHPYSTTVDQYLPQGQYYVAHGFSRMSAGAAVFSGMHGMFLLQSNFAAAGHPIGTTGFDSPVGMQQAGSFTTRVISTNTAAAANVPIGGNPCPASFASSIISATASGDIRMLMPQFHHH